MRHFLSGTETVLNYKIGALGLQPFKDCRNYFFSHASAFCQNGIGNKLHNSKMLAGKNSYLPWDGCNVFYSHNYFIISIEDMHFPVSQGTVFAVHLNKLAMSSRDTLPEASDS